LEVFLAERRCCAGGATRKLRDQTNVEAIEHSVLMANTEGRDLENVEAYERWIAHCAPGVPAETSSLGSNSL
jgi:hypothetical protein